MPSATPIPTDRPIPRLPFENSIPFSLLITGCPGKSLLSLSKFLISFLLINSNSMSAEYKIKHACPLLKINLSLNTSVGLFLSIDIIEEYKQATISAKERLHLYEHYLIQHVSISRIFFFNFFQKSLIDINFFYQASKHSSINSYNLTI